MKERHIKLEIDLNPEAESYYPLDSTSQVQDKKNTNQRIREIQRRDSKTKQLILINRKSNIKNI